VNVLKKQAEILEKTKEKQCLKIIFKKIEKSVDFPEGEAILS